MRARRKYGGWEVFAAALGIEALMVAWLIIDSSLRQIGFYFGSRVRFGCDFYDFYIAAIDCFWGRNPYLKLRFNKPPWVALASASLTWLTPRPAAQVFFSVNLLSLVGAILLCAHEFLGVRKPRDLLGWGLAAFIAIGFSAPSFFLLDRGNLDGVVALFCSLYFVWWSKRDSAYLAGIALGVAVCIKVYPVLLILPAIVFLEYRILAAFGATMVYSFATSPRLWWQFLSSDTFIGRVVAVDIQKENGSLAQTLNLVAHSFSPSAPDSIAPLWVVVATLLVVLIVLGTAVVDFRLRTRLTARAKIILAMTYIPWMFAVPKSVFFYEYVNLLPWCVALGAAGSSLDLKRLGISRYPVLCGVLIGFSQFPAISFIAVLGGANWWRLGIIPGISHLWLCLLPTVGLRWVLLRHEDPCLVESRIPVSAQLTPA